MCSKVDPEQTLLVGWLQSCKCPLWMCLFCTCLGPSVTQALSRAILKKFQSITFLILELRLLWSKCLNEYLISVIWGKVGKYLVIYWIKSFTSSDVLEILNFHANKKKKEFFKFYSMFFFKKLPYPQFVSYNTSHELQHKKSSHHCRSFNVFFLTANVPEKKCWHWILNFLLLLLLFYKATINNIFSVVLFKWKQFL